MDKFTDQLTDIMTATRQASINHPFIQALSRGTLPLSIFRYYLIQDNHYLTAFNHLHRLAAQNLPKNEAIILIHLGEGEDAAQQQIHQEIGLTQKELQNTSIAPASYAYITHMYYQLGQYGTAVGCAGLLPCYWLYSEVGLRLAKKKSSVALYQEFFDSYAGQDFTTSTKQMKQIVNQQAAISDNLTRQRMKRAFVISCHYERAFWQMAYTREQW